MALGCSHSKLNCDLKALSNLHFNLSSPQPYQNASAKPSPYTKQLNEFQDPFTNFQLSSNGKGRLRPVLTKHRRTPTLPRVHESPDIEPLKMRKSVSLKVMRSVFRTDNRRGTSQKINLLKINAENNSEAKREVQTPYFKPHPRSVERYEKTEHLNHKRNGRTLFFDHVKKNNPVEVSFGTLEKAKEIRTGRIENSEKVSKEHLKKEEEIKKISDFFNEKKELMTQNYKNQLKTLK